MSPLPICKSLLSIVSRDLTCRQITSLCSLEEAAIVDEQADKVVSAFEENDSHAMHESIKVILKIASSESKVHRTKHVTDSNGVHAQSAVQEQLIFRDYFAELLDGHVQSFETLVYKDRFPSDTRFDSVSPRDIISNTQCENELGFLRFFMGVGV